MTPILFLLCFAAGLVLAFVRHPVYGLYTYFLTFYLTPSDTWWRNDVPDLRYLLIAAVVTLIATVRLPDTTGREKWYRTTPVKLFMLFIAYTWIQMAWAIDRDIQYDLAFLLTKHLIVIYLIYRLADTPEAIRRIAIIHVVGCAWFGYQALDASGGRLETIGGAVATSNKLGVHVSTALLFGGILLLTLRDVRRWLVFACLPLVANTLVLTISRGAFLGFFSGGIAGYLAIPKRYRKQYVLAGLLGIVLVSMLAHNALIERFTETFGAMTSEEQELDRSATSRIEIARAGIKIGLDHPLGAGAKATERLSAPYISGWEHGRAAHNTITEIFAEHGFPGLLLYLLIILWVVRTTLRLRKAGEVSREVYEPLGVLGAMVGASLFSIYVAGNFSSNLELETQYWCLALLASLSELQRVAGEEAADARDTSAIVAGGESQPSGRQHGLARRGSRSAPPR